MKAPGIHPLAYRILPWVKRPVEEEPTRTSAEPPSDEEGTGRRSRRHVNSGGLKIDASGPPRTHNTRFDLETELCDRPAFGESTDDIVIKSKFEVDIDQAKAMLDEEMDDFVATGDIIEDYGNTVVKVGFALGGLSSCGIGLEPQLAAPLLLALPVCLIGYGMKYANKAMVDYAEKKLTQAREALEICAKPEEQDQIRHEAHGKLVDFSNDLNRIRKFQSAGKVLVSGILSETGPLFAIAVLAKDMWEKFTGKDISPRTLDYQRAVGRIGDHLKPVRA